MGDPRHHVVLVGLMGVGKSTVGRRLAKELARPFADVDEQVELRAGLAIPRIFEERGEPAFRALEADVLADLLHRAEPLVLAAGGGVPESFSGNRKIEHPNPVDVMEIETPSGATEFLPFNASVVKKVELPTRIVIESPSYEPSDEEKEG